MTRLFPCMAGAGILLCGASAGATEPSSTILLDFGDEDAIVMPGFAGVTPYRSADARVRWVTEPSGSQSQPWSDPLVDDQINGGELHLDLPRGRYALGALFDDALWNLRASPGRRSGLRAGDDELAVVTVPDGADFFASRHYAANPRPVFRRDGAVFDRQVVPTLPWRTSTVDVGDHGLDLAPFGAPLAALVVAPTDLATLEVELALVDARRRDWSLAHKPDTPMDALPFAAEGPLAVEVISWDALPDPGRARPRARVEVAAAPGERISLLVAIHGGDAPVQAAFDGLDGLDVTLHEVTWLDIVERRVRRVRPQVLQPILGEVRGGQGLTPLVAVSFRVPSDALPGPRPARLNLARGDERATLDLALRVRDLHLAPPTSSFGVWTDLRGAAASVYGPDAPATQAVWREDVRVMREHDVEVIGLRGTYYPGALSLLGRGVPRSRLAWAVQAWRDAGGGRVTWVDPAFVVMDAETPDDPDRPLTPEGQAWLSEAFAVAAELDVDAYVVDESIMAHGPGHRPHYARLLDACRRLADAHGARLAGATPHAAAWPIAADRLDLVFVNRFPTLDPRNFDYFAGRRATAYAYNLSFQREATGLYGWVLGAGATVIWHFNEPFNDPFNDARVRNQYQLAVLAPDGASVWPTRRLVDLSLGVQDQRMISTVAGLVDEVGHKRRARPEVDRACTLLRLAGAGVRGRLPEDFDDLGLFDDGSLQDLHDELGDSAEALARRSRTQRALRRGRERLLEPTRWPERCGTPPWSDGAQLP